jgi:hypothetical protein
MVQRLCNSVQAIIQAALSGQWNEQWARKLHALGPEAVNLFGLALSQAAQKNGAAQAGGGLVSPTTPSGMVPLYTKPNTNRRRKKPGARKGHIGTRRARPTQIDRKVTHRLKQCPDCGGRLQRCHRMRTRIIEDIPENIQPVVTEHTIHRDHCPRCKKHVEPIVPDALPKAELGHHFYALTAWLHYGLGSTISQIVEILGYHLQTRITSGGLIQGWHRLADILNEWYEQIGTEGRKSAVLHADETGWRVEGQTHWLWCFANSNECYYMIDRSRGSPALQAFFTEIFRGVLITDFWAAYESVDAQDRQYCLVHLLRELEKVDQKNRSPEWMSFARRLRRLLREGILLRKRKGFSPKKWPADKQRLHNRLMNLASTKSVDKDVRRLAKRLMRYSDFLFTFLDYKNVPFENNHAERQIRPAVIIRKNSLSNRSDRGAKTQAVLMSVYRTLKLRNHNPTKTIADALKTYLKTGQLPPLPQEAIADG